MNKRIFNILLVALLVFIIVFFAIKISNYATELEKGDNLQVNHSIISPYTYTNSL